MQGSSSKPGIRELRERRGWNVEQLSVQSGVSGQTIRRIENKVPVSRLYVARVCQALNVDIDDVDVVLR